jgi:hypothetical protein
MRKVLWAGVLLTACGADHDSLGSGGDEEQATARQAVVWNPTNTLITQHVAWHTAPCSVNGQPLGGQDGVGRRCSRPGEDFLVWHRAYIDRLRDDFEAQGLTHDITPWYSVPAELRSQQAWTPRAQAGIDAMATMINPDTGMRFASLDEFGTFVEGSFHGALHGASAQLWGTTDQIVAGFMSPRSTIFLKIHGLVEFHTRRFLQGDFNWNGKSDLFVRNLLTGNNQIWNMDNTSVLSKSDTRWVGVDGCNWYAGATTDLNLDGWTDVIWHSPGCNEVHAWVMNGTTWQFSLVLPGVDSAWTLIGSGDFNNDVRSDLVWRHNASNDVHVWRMNGSAYVSSLVLDIPAGWTPILVADLNDDGQSDLIYRRVIGGTPQHAVQYTVPGGGLGGQFNISGVGGDMFAVPYAVGRYQTRGSVGDLLIERHPPANTPGTIRFAPLNTISSGSPSYFPETPAIPLVFTEVVQGPR